MTDGELKKVLASSGFGEDEAASFLDRLTLPRRSGWNRDMPQRCTERDAFPWRFRRQLSLLMRPLVELGGEQRTWFVSVPMLEKAFAYLVGNVFSGNFPQEFFGSAEMRSYIGGVANKRGHDFNAEVTEVFSESGLASKSEVEMTALGAPEDEGLGDIDVLAWNPEDTKVYVVESKCLRPASTVSEVVQRLDDFAGDREEKDALGRHLRRLDWLETNRTYLEEFIGMPGADIHIVPMLVTNETVPMQFFENVEFPSSQVVPIEMLRGKL